MFERFINRILKRYKLCFWGLHCRIYDSTGSGGTRFVDNGLGSYYYEFTKVGWNCKYCKKRGYEIKTWRVS